MNEQFFSTYPLFPEAMCMVRRKRVPTARLTVKELVSWEFLNGQTVWTVRFSPTGDLVIGCMSDGEVRVWSASNQ